MSSGTDGGAEGEATGRAFGLGVLGAAAVAALGTVPVFGGLAVGLPIAAGALLCHAALTRRRSASRPLEAGIARAIATAAAAAAAGAFAAGFDLRSAGGVLAGGLIGVVAVAPWRRFLCARAGAPFPEATAAASLAAGPAPAAAGRAAAGGAGAGVALSLIGGGVAAAFLALGFFGGLGVALAVLLGALAALVIPGGSSVAVAALAGASLGVLVRSLPGFVSTLREPAPFRVRFEIGGEGTRIEDLTPTTERELSTAARLLLLVGAGAVLARSTGCGALEAAAIVAAAFVLVPAAAFVAARVGATAGIVVGAAVLGAPGAVGTMGAGHSVVPGFAGIAGLALAVACAVGADLAQNHAASRAAGGTPRRVSKAAIAGVLVAGAVGAVVAAFTPSPATLAVSVAPAGLPTETSLADVGAGVAFFAAALLRAPALPVAVGLFLSPLLAAALVFGALVRRAVRSRGEAALARGTWFGGGLGLGPIGAAVFAPILASIGAVTLPILVWAGVVAASLLYARSARGSTP